MPSCNHCGSHVSDCFARVFSDQNGALNACPSCSANAGIAEVARKRTRTRTRQGPTGSDHDDRPQ